MNEKKIAIIGFGELGNQLYGFLSENKKSNFVFFDDTLFLKNKNNVFRFIDYSNEKFKNYDFYVGLGYHRLKEKIEVINQLLILKRKLPGFYHSSCFINKDSTIGAGTYIYPMCNIDKQTKIGNGVLLNNSVCISHNSSIGNGCYISPGVILSGNVEVGERTFVGSGAIISNNIKIGSNVRIGIGSVVTENVPDGFSAIGNPVRIIKRKLKLI